MPPLQILTRNVTNTRRDTIDRVRKLSHEAGFAGDPDQTHKSLPSSLRRHCERMLDRRPGRYRMGFMRGYNIHKNIYELTKNYIIDKIYPSIMGLCVRWGDGYSNRKSEELNDRACKARETRGYHRVRQAAGARRRYRIRRGARQFRHPVSRDRRARGQLHAPGKDHVYLHR